MAHAPVPLTIHQHIAAVRHQAGGLAALVKAIREDAAFADEVRGELRRISDMEKQRPERMEACWISRTTKETLTAALAAATTQPEVPAGA